MWMFALNLETELEEVRKQREKDELEEKAKEKAELVNPFWKAITIIILIFVN